MKSSPMHERGLKNTKIQSRYPRFVVFRNSVMAPKIKKKMLISAVVDIDNKSFYFLGETFSSELNFKLLG
jgi:hypothetical protein